ncbi:MAG: type II toxin-antitoxin system VapC family toxin [Candidatus Omnitrophica bacterium]|nr:type II toxin-antitoxin system VapC family toxin [Candidatus Omnitrophota bacterium]
MKAVFADTFYFLALTSSKDPAHAEAVDYTRNSTAELVTTGWVILELADAMAQPNRRRQFQELFRSLEEDPLCRIIPVNQSTFERGLKRFFERPDKEWSLTDCLSFVVMESEGIQEALTGDHHFTQAGFVSLFENF